MLFHKISVDLILNSLNVTADVSKRKPFSYCFNFTAPNLLFSNLIIPWLSCSQSQHFTVRRHNLSFSYYVQQGALVILIQLELLKLKIRPKGKLQSPQLDFLLLMQPERNPQENEGLMLIMRRKSQKRKMMNMQTSKSFVQSQNMTSLSLICQKIWLSTQMIISTNLFRKKIYKKEFQLKTQFLLIFNH